jgi:hypothetical protein
MFATKCSINIQETFLKATDSRHQVNDEVHIRHTFAFDHKKHTYFI